MLNINFYQSIQTEKIIRFNRSIRGGESFIDRVKINLSKLKKDISFLILLRFISIAGHIILSQQKKRIIQKVCFLFPDLNSRIGPEFVEADANMSKKETKKSLKSKK